MVLALMGLGAVPALACSTPLLTITDETEGVFQQETIAYAPFLFFREARSATAVTRFWGTPPAFMGAHYGGGDWFPFTYTSSCGRWNDSLGRTRYGLTEYVTGEHRFAYPFEFPSGESAPTAVDLTLLEERFGAPVAVEVSFWVSFRATISVWYPSVLFMAGLIGAIVLATRRIIRRRGARTV